MGDDSKKKKETPDASESSSSQDEVFWFSLVEQKIPNELLGATRRASLKLRITKRFKIIAAASSLAVFAILAYIFGFVLRLF